MVRVVSYWEYWTQTDQTLAKATLTLVKGGGGWDRRNRLKAHKALVALFVQDN